MDCSVLSIKSLWQDLSKTAAAPLFEKCVYPWEILALIGGFARALGEQLLKEDDYILLGDGIVAAKSARIAPSASITGPVVIGPNTEIRHCAYIRTSAVIGAGVTIGNSSEIKNSVIFDGAQLPHYNYIGDSVIGYKSHLGAGALTSNVKSDKTNVTVSLDGEKIATDCRKFGAAIGDHVEIGCHTVLNPGSVIGGGTNIYPLSFVRGYVPANSIYKKQGEVVEKY